MQYEVYITQILIKYESMVCLGCHRLATGTSKWLVDIMKINRISIDILE